ncbi:MAG: nucleotide sugar dehydrogenase [Thermoanaerobaculia bacterium]
MIGAGYVGLPLSLHLARAGLRVTAIDIDPRVVQAINDRTCKIDEKEDFEKFFQDPDVQSHLTAQSAPVEADAFVIAVPTPVDHESKKPDLSAVDAATESIVPVVRPGNLVVVESTIPPLTMERRVKPILEKSGYRVGDEILLAHCPERILPGNIMAEAVYNARVVGGVNELSSQRAAELFGSFVKGKLCRTNLRTAEFVKLIENAYRDVNVAFANQAALLCERLGIEAYEAIALANEHPRVQILNPGIGVGGHCIPIDPWFLIDACPEVSGLLRAARALNDEMPRRTTEKILRAIDGVAQPRVACLGVTYKPNVRDMRESPSFEVYRLLREKDVDVSLFDPLVPEYACDSVLSVARGVDALAILVPHDLFVTEIRYRKQEILGAMRRPNLLTFTPGVL